MILISNLENRFRLIGFPNLMKTVKALTFLAMESDSIRTERLKRINRDQIGDLLQEFPTETKVAHFRHVRDNNYGLCLSCCALGIVRFSTFANAYGQGRYTSAINGPTPAYAIPQGTTLLQTMQLNWGNASIIREPPWICDSSPEQENLDIVTVFAWRSRKLWLSDCGIIDEKCSYCGQQSRLIKQMAFTGNWHPPFQTKGTQKKFWDQDPHLIIEVVSGKKGKTDDEADGISSQNETNAVDDSFKGKKQVITTLGFPSPGPSSLNTWEILATSHHCHTYSQIYHGFPLNPR